MLIETKYNVGDKVFVVEKGIEQLEVYRVVTFDRRVRYDFYYPHTGSIASFFEENVFGSIDELAKHYKKVFGEE